MKKIYEKANVKLGLLLTGLSAMPLMADDNGALTSQDLTSSSATLQKFLNMPLVNGGIQAGLFGLSGYFFGKSFGLIGGGDSKKSFDIKHFLYGSAVGLTFFSWSAIKSKIIGFF